ncbi:MAG TPA: hypothetical protein VIK78_08950 [Ruminiclostridium sp.]
MNRIMYVSFLCIGLLFICVLGGCGDKSQNIKTSDKTATLPAVEVVSKDKIIPNGGASLDKIKGLIVQYLKDEGFKGDIQSKVSIDEITIKEAWENLRVQLYKVKLEYASIDGVAVVKDDKLLSMIEGMPVFEIFLADIDRDSKYEIYVNTSFGSGIVSSDVSGYNIATNTKYYMSKRMAKDFKSFIKDNELLVKEYRYGTLRSDFDTSNEIKALKIEKDKLVLENSTYGFAIYKVKAESVRKALTYGSVKNGEYISGGKKYLSELEIEDTPLFTDRDIEKYNFKTNTIVFNAEFLKKHALAKDELEALIKSKELAKNGVLRLSLYGGSKLLGCSDSEAVVVTVGEDRIYSSGFVLAACWSRLPPEITIGDSDLNSITISSQTDLKYLIQDKRIHDFFKKIGKLEE